MLGLAIAVLYAGTVVLGLRAKSLRWPTVGAARAIEFAWQIPDPLAIPLDVKGESIRRGAQLFTLTPIYAPQYVRARLSCASCHAAAGIQPWAAPMVGAASAYPQFNNRAGRVISLRDRIEECVVRSENGDPLPPDSAEMQALVDYIEWLSQPQPGRAAFVGRGFVILPQLRGDARRGARVYAEQCAGCHGERGEGNAPLFPPLWGPDSFNDGAGMTDVAKMAAFVQQNMPQNRMGILSPQDAFDVAAFVHAQRRPQFNSDYARY
jgi:thiosulfate dehydrogenase